MKRLTMLSITLMALALMTELAIAQRGGGRSGSPAGPPPMSERGQSQTHSSKPTRESSATGSVNREQQTQPKTVSTQLEKNTHLAAKLQKLFPGNQLTVGIQRFQKPWPVCRGDARFQKLGNPV